MICSICSEETLCNAIDELQFAIAKFEKTNDFFEERDFALESEQWFRIFQERVAETKTLADLVTYEKLSGPFPPELFYIVRVHLIAALARKRDRKIFKCVNVQQQHDQKQSPKDFKDTDMHNTISKLSGKKRKWQFQLPLVCAGRVELRQLHPALQEIHLFCMKETSSGIVHALHAHQFSEKDPTCCKGSFTYHRRTDGKYYLATVNPHTCEMPNK